MRTAIFRFRVRSTAPLKSRQYREGTEKWVVSTAASCRRLFCSLAGGWLPESDCGEAGACAYFYPDFQRAAAGLRHSCNRGLSGHARRGCFRAGADHPKNCFDTAVSCPGWTRPQMADFLQSERGQGIFSRGPVEKLLGTLRENIRCAGNDTIPTVTLRLKHSSIRQRE